MSERLSGRPCVPPERVHISEQSAEVPDAVFGDRFPRVIAERQIEAAWSSVEEVPAPEGLEAWTGVDEMVRRPDVFEKNEAPLAEVFPGENNTRVDSRFSRGISAIRQIARALRPTRNSKADERIGDDGLFTGRRPTLPSRIHIEHSASGQVSPAECQPRFARTNRFPFVVSDLNPVPAAFQASSRTGKS